MKLRLALVAALVAPLSALANEQSSADELLVYKRATESGLVLCNVSYLLDQAKAKHAAVTGQSAGVAELSGCIEEHAQKAKAALTPALESQPKEAAQKALKLYHVAFVTALKGIEPGTTERQFSYDARQQGLKDKLNQAWELFEIER